MFLAYFTLVALVTTAISLFVGATANIEEDHKLEDACVVCFLISGVFSISGVLLTIVLHLL